MKDYIISLKKTKFSSYRFVLPKEWLKNILNDKNERTIINNYFLNTKKNKLKKVKFVINQNQLMYLLIKDIEYFYKQHQT